MGKDRNGAVGAARSGEDRILTVPNLLSVIRLCLIPVFVWLLFGRESRFGAAVLLASLGATDWVDGFVARRFNQVSNLGKVLDPTADRLLLGVAVISILIDGSIPWVMAIPVMIREALVAGTTVYLGLRGAKRIDVIWAGKAGTFALMFCFPLFLAGNDKAVGIHAVFTFLGWVAAGLGLGFGWYAAVKYVPLARAALVEVRSQHS